MKNLLYILFLFYSFSWSQNLEVLDRLRQEQIGVTYTEPPSESQINYLTNFRIEKDYPDRIYYDHYGVSSTGTDWNLTPGSIHIGNGTYTVTGGSVYAGYGYFTLNASVTFWDNLTIRYNTGAINVVGTGDLPELELTYIDNQIAEPVSSTIRYVSVSGSGSNDGTSESNSWTLSQALSNLSSGMTVYVKSGDYGSGNYSITTSGNATNPIKIIGYENSPGDTPSYLFNADTNNTPDETKMPLLQGGTGIGINIISDYIILRNFQIDYYSTNFNVNGGRTGVILDNIYGFNPAAGFYNIHLDSDASTKCRLINSVGYGGGTVIVRWYGTQMLIEDVKTIQPNGRTVGVDYYIVTRGDNNIVRNIYMEHEAIGVGHTGHGMCVKSVGVSTEYGLYENMIIKGIKGAIEARHDEVAFNVFRNFTITRGNQTFDSDYAGGIWIMNGSHDNIYDRIWVDGCDFGVRIEASSEKTDAPTAGFNNIFKNCLFTNNYRGIFPYTDSYASRVFYDNTWKHCTFYGSVYRNFDISLLAFTNLQFINCNFSDNIGNDDNSEIIYTNCNVYNSTGTYQADYAFDPQFVNVSGGDYTPQNASLIVVSRLSDVEFDFSLNKRENITTIGYKKHASE